MKKIKRLLLDMFDYDTDWSLLRNMHDRRM